MFGYRNLGFGAFPNRGVDFSVANSARFVDDDSDHLVRTPSFVGNGFAWTLAFWFKIGVVDGRKHFFGQDDAYISINENSSTSHKINIYNVGRGAQSGSNATGWYWETKALFRDPHAWAHLVVAFDSLQADAATFSADNALRVYANGVELTEFDPKHNSGTQYNGLATNAGFHDIGSNEKMVIGKHPVNAAQYWDGYLAQMVYINGRQLTPTSFGEFDTGGRWKPKDLTNTLAASSTAEAIVNVASAVDALSGGDAVTATFSSVALGTASSTREAYVFVSGQENSGTAGTITATMNTGSGAVAMTKIIDVNNTTEAHYQASLFKISVSSGTSGDIVVTNTRQMSQIGVIVWTVTGDHHVFDLKVDTDTSSSTTTTVDLTDVPANSVILAGRASATGDAHTWSSNLTENIDEKVEETGASDVRHTGASTATASGGDFTITCAPDSGSDSRGRMFVLALSPTEGAGRNGFYLPFTNSVELGFSADRTSSTAATVSFTANANSTSNLTNYTFSSQALGTAATGRIIAVVVMGARSSAGARTVSSLTVGGVSAALVVRQTSDNGDAHEIWEAQVPSGTSGDVVVNFSAAMLSAGVGVYAVYNAKYQEHFTTSSEGNDLSGTLVIPENSIAIGGGNSVGGTLGTFVGLTENYDETVEDRTHAGASTSTASDAGGGTTIEFNPGTPHVDDTLVAATWFPLDGPNHFIAG